MAHPIIHMPTAYPQTHPTLSGSLSYFCHKMLLLSYFVKRMLCPLYIGAAEIYTPIYRIHKAYKVVRSTKLMSLIVSRTLRSKKYAN